MNIYESLIERVQNGESFYVNLKKGLVKIGPETVIENNTPCAKDVPLLEEDMMTNITEHIEKLYEDYKYSVASAASEHKSSYFSAIPDGELDEFHFLTGLPRLVAQARLEIYVACLKAMGLFKLDFGTGWFWQSPNDKDLVILRKWVETM